MHDLPALTVRVAEEDACTVVLDGIQVVVAVDDLGEERCLRESDEGDLRVVGLEDFGAKCARAEDGSVLSEEALVVSEVIGIDLEEI